MQISVTQVNMAWENEYKLHHCVLTEAWNPKELVTLEMLSIPKEWAKQRSSFSDGFGFTCNQHFKKRSNTQVKKKLIPTTEYNFPPFSLKTI